MEAYKIISIAGLPASGKSTLIHQACLSKKTKCIQHKDLHGSFSLDLPKAHDTFIKMQEDRMDSYLADLNITRRKHPKKHILCDRGLHDMKCFTEYTLHAHYRIPEIETSYLTEGLNQFIDGLKLIYIETNISVREERELSRNRKSLGRHGINPRTYWHYYANWFKRIRSLEIHDNNDCIESSSTKFTKLISTDN